MKPQIRWASMARNFSLAVFLLVLALPAQSRGQSNPPAYSTTAHYVVGDLVSYEGNTYRCIHNIVNPNLLPTTAYSFWELNYVAVDTTLNIGAKQRFPSIVAAWKYGLNARIAENASLMLYISTTNGNFIENFQTPFSLDHPFGSRISLAADFQPKNLLSFTNASDGFIVDRGHSFGGLFSLTIAGTAAATGTSGVKATTGGNFGTVGRCVIESFDADITASHNGSITVTGTAMKNFTLAGCHADSGGSVEFPTGAFINGNVGGTGWSVGLYATNNGQIFARNSNLAGLPYGVEAVRGGMVDVEFSTITGCSTGCHAIYHGTVDCQQATLSGSSWYDAAADSGGIVDAMAATLSKTFHGDSDGSYIYH